MNEYERLNFKRLVSIVFDRPFTAPGFTEGYIRGLVFSQWGPSNAAFSMVADYGAGNINMEGEPAQCQA